MTSHIFTNRYGNTYQLECFYCNETRFYSVNQRSQNIIAHNMAFAAQHAHCASRLTSPATESEAKTLPAYIGWRCAGCCVACLHADDRRVHVYHPNHPTQPQSYCHADCLGKAADKGYQVGYHGLIKLSPPHWSFYWLGEGGTAKSYRQAKEQLALLQQGVCYDHERI